MNTGRRFVPSILVLFVTTFLLSMAFGQTVIDFYRFGDQTQSAYLDPLVEAFEAEHPDIQIDSVLIVEGGYEALLQRVRLAAASGDAPDLAQVGYTYVPTMTDLGAVPLNDYIANDPDFDADVVIPAILDLGRVDGELYGMPFATSTPVMYYNTEAFEEAGLDPEDPPETWEEARQAAQALVDAGYEGIIWDWDITGNWIFQAMLESAGGQLSGDDPRVSSFNSEAGQQTLEYLEGLSEDELMPVTTDATNLFRSGELGMLISSSNSLSGLVRDAGFTVRVGGIPAPASGERALPAGGNTVVMLSDEEEKQQAAWEFLKFIASEEAGRIVAENSGYLPSNAELVDALGEERGDDPNYSVLLSQLPQVVQWHSWPGANGPRIVELLRDMQEGVLLDRVQPQAALEDTEARVNELLQR